MSNDSLQATYSHGDTYEGQWVDDIREGEGTFTYDNDGKTYVGDFVSDFFNGWGALHMIGGEKYEGEWKNGKKETQLLIAQQIIHSNDYCT